MVASGSSRKDGHPSVMNIRHVEEMTTILSLRVSRRCHRGQGRRNSGFSFDNVDDAEGDIGRFFRKPRLKCRPEFSSAAECVVSRRSAKLAGVAYRSTPQTETCQSTAVPSPRRRRGRRRGVIIVDDGDG